MTAEVEEPLHISSFVVRCLPERLQEIMSAVAAMPGVEIHGDDGCGKFVALLELESDAELMNTITAIELLKGIVNTSMVYHHTE